MEPRGFIPPCLWSRSISNISISTGLVNFKLHVLGSFETFFPFPASSVVLKFGLLDLLQYYVASLESFNLRKENDCLSDT